ncbi:MAG: hypothetical protein Q8O76_01020 [Chloroflexota bacterium]|nr:hypothetical protein [Chloroflexota bacterium]
MKDTTALKGLGDLKTATTARLRSLPPQEGMEHLYLYLANKEKKRLAKLTETWEKHQRRTRERLATTDKALARLEEKVGLGTTTAPLPHPRPGEEQPEAPDYTRRPWKTISLEY